MFFSNLYVEIEFPVWRCLNVGIGNPRSTEVEAS